MYDGQDVVFSHCRAGMMSCSAIVGRAKCSVQPLSGGQNVVFSSCRAVKM